VFHKAWIRVVDSVFKAVDELRLRDERSTIVVEKYVGGGGWMWMMFRLIPSHPQRHGHLSNGAEVIMHARMNE
jgi:hypothetical protein